MDVLFSVEERVSQSMVNKHEIVRYGDPLVLESCASREPTFLAIVRQMVGKRSPSVLQIEAAAIGQYPSADYQWTFVPVPGTRKKRGDPVSFADRLRIQTFDFTGNYRHLAMVPPELTYPAHGRHIGQTFAAVAEKTPGGSGVATWLMASTARLRTEPGGRVVPDGDPNFNVEFGEGNYIALINSARYLSISPHPHRGLSNSVSTVLDLPASGMAAWWRIRRSLSDARPSR